MGAVRSSSISESPVRIGQANQRYNAALQCVIRRSARGWEWYRERGVATGLFGRKKLTLRSTSRGHAKL
jgi:hypothetical protein